MHLITEARSQLMHLDTIIAVIVLDFSISHIPKPLLKTSFAHNCLVCTKRNLIFNPNEARGSIVVYSTPLEATILRFTAITLRQTTGSSANKLISGDKVTNFKSITTKSSLFFRVSMSMFNPRGYVAPRPG